MKTMYPLNITLGWLSSLRVSSRLNSRLMFWCFYIFLKQVTDGKVGKKWFEEIVVVLFVVVFPSLRPRGEELSKATSLSITCHHPSLDKAPLLSYILFFLFISYILLISFPYMHPLLCILNVYPWHLLSICSFRNRNVSLKYVQCMSVCVFLTYTSGIVICKSPFVSSVTHHCFEICPCSFLKTWLITLHACFCRVQISFILLVQYLVIDT